MQKVNRKILQALIDESSEPVLLVRADHPDWPVVLENPAYKAVAGKPALRRPFTEIVEKLVNRELAVEVSEAIRGELETSFPLEISGREYLLVIKPLLLPGDKGARFYGAFWRGAASFAGGGELQNALLKAKRRIRDLSRDDPVTGLLTENAFREVFEHDWVVAARERSLLAVIAFDIEDFDAYIDVFGRHATDSALRRVGQSIRRSLRRASDVAARSKDNRILVLSHSTAEENLHEFAEKISATVQELGLHHPRSSTGRYVSVSFEVAAIEPIAEERSPKQFLEELLGRCNA